MGDGESEKKRAGFLISDRGDENEVQSHLWKGKAPGRLVHEPFDGVGHEEMVIRC